MYLLQCPKCHNKMKYEGRDRVISLQRKQCVYCGMSFAVKGRVVREVVK